MNRLPRVHVVVQIVLLGVCMSPGANGDAADELTLQPLPLYACSSDNVTMCSVATTPDGRIFTGGANGLLYEIVYNSTDTWRKKRCYKVSRHTLQAASLCYHSCMQTKKHCDL